MKELLTVLMVNHAQVTLFNQSDKLPAFSDCNKDFFPSWLWTVQVFPMGMRNGWAMRLMVVCLEFI